MQFFAEVEHLLGANLLSKFPGMERDDVASLIHIHYITSVKPRVNHAHLCITTARIGYVPPIQGVSQ